MKCTALLHPYDALGHYHLICPFYGDAHKYGHAGWETQEDGFIARLLVANGTKDISIGTPVAVVVESADDISAFASFSPRSSPSSAQPPLSSPLAASEEVPASAATARSDRLGPAARMALANKGLHATDVTPTGPKGIVTKADVIAARPAATGAKPTHHQPVTATAPAAAARPLPPSTASPAPTSTSTPGRVQRATERYIDIPVTTMRSVIAKRLLQSKLTIPAIYVAADVKLDALTALRTVLKGTGVKASVNDFVVKACSLALRAVPAVCAGWDAKAEAVVKYVDADISVAVATEGGLITPIVKRADALSLPEIGAAVRDLAGARVSLSVFCTLSCFPPSVLSHSLPTQGNKVVAQI
jgi:pyruvate dehydrogenase E2 component (dihydrolipoamide acetyltransferase)